jgi:uncharacterized membrane protein (DUF485 family)
MALDTLRTSTKPVLRQALEFVLQATFNDPSFSPHTVCCQWKDVLDAFDLVWFIPLVVLASWKAATMPSPPNPWLDLRKPLLVAVTPFVMWFIITPVQKWYSAGEFMCVDLAVSEEMDLVKAVAYIAMVIAGVEAVALAVWIFEETQRRSICWRCWRW